ncbi:MAG: hypothetical protein KIS30_05850 [Thermoplasmata archaeon]|nr:hypothetical protein [Candidatus Sysuiplasma acidicola]MBX8637245.1 hypothetical protein [Candidatus Sysuiplasma acidicola]MBX8646263.1 hypothetical protein [Candidatus Sysuiplasma acidicola]MDH2905387.1 hypothetical protein [Methanomassiliicoccales archaeon]
MRLLGVAKCSDSAGRIVVDAVVAPLENERVFDRRGKGVGVVKEIIGSVEKPFVSVSTGRNFGRTGAVGLELYIQESETDGESKGNKGRSRRS